MQNNLISVQADILLQLLQIWLVLKEVALLDSAVCNRNLRKDFLIALSSLNVEEQPAGNFSIRGYFEWQTRRGIPIRAITLQSVDSDASGYLADKPQSCLSTLKKLFRKNHPDESYLTKWLSRTLSRNSHSLQQLSIVAGNDLSTFSANVCDSIAKCKQLRSLRLSNQGGTQALSLSCILEGCQALEELCLDQCRFNVNHVYSISKGLVSFEYTSFEYGHDSAYSRQTVEAVITHCTALRSFTVRYDSLEHIFDAPMYVLMAEHLPQLQHFSARSNDPDCSGLATLFDTCAQLQSLSFGNCHTMTSATFTALVLHQNVTHLELYGNTNITGMLDFTLQTTYTIHGTLESLTLSRFWRLTNEGLANLLSFCPALLTLEIVGCSQLTVDAVDSIVQLCPQLKTVKFRGTPGLAEAIVMPRLQQLHTSVEFTFGTLNYLSWDE